MVRKKKPIPKSPAITDAYLKFYSEMYRVDRFFKLIFDISKKNDDIRTESVKLSAKFKWDEFAHGDESLEGKLQELSSTGAVNAVMSESRLVMELLTTRNVDNYLSYVSQILADIFRSRPETLRSNEQVRLDFVLSHESMSDLIAEIADRQVNKLSYQGMTELADYLKEKIGLDVFTSDENRKNIIKAIEIRNLIVHSRGVVNKIYLKRISDCGLEIGMDVPLDAQIGILAVKSLHESVQTIDDQARKKFGVKNTRIRFVDK